MARIALTLLCRLYFLLASVLTDLRRSLSETKSEKLWLPKLPGFSVAGPCALLLAPTQRFQIRALECCEFG